MVIIGSTSGSVAEKTTSDFIATATVVGIDVSPVTSRGHYDGSSSRTVALSHKCTTRWGGPA